jgi:hypothetical protein
MFTLYLSDKEERTLHQSAIVRQLQAWITAMKAFACDGGDGWVVVDY